MALSLCEIKFLCRVLEIEIVSALHGNLHIALQFVY